MSRSDRLAPFEGLRGIAALVVLVHHLRLAFWGDPFDAVRRLVSSLPPVFRSLGVFAVEAPFNGLFAVYLFWILSAFVLSRRYFELSRRSMPSEANRCLGDGFIRRYPRLLIPVLVSVLFAYGLHRAGWMANLDLASRLPESDGRRWLVQWYAFPPDFLASLDSAFRGSFFGYSAATSYNPVLWTMEKEYHGSLFLFLFLWLFGRRPVRFLLYVLIALAGRKLGWDWLDAFVLGIALCDLHVHRERWNSRFGTGRLSPAWRLLEGWPVVVIWCGLLLAMGMPNHLGIHYLVLGCVMVGLALGSRATAEFLSHPWLQFLGRISFGLYLIHLPILCGFACRLHLRLLDPLGPLPAACLASALAVVLSLLGGHLVSVFADRPAIVLAKAISARVHRFLGLEGTSGVPVPGRGAEGDSGLRP